MLEKNHLDIIAEELRRQDKEELRKKKLNHEKKMRN